MGTTKTLKKAKTAKFEKSGSSKIMGINPKYNRKVLALVVYCYQGGFYTLPEGEYLTLKDMGEYLASKGMFYTRNGERLLSARTLEDIFKEMLLDMEKNPLVIIWP
jgi:hypothetical protein